MSQERLEPPRHPFVLSGDVFEVLFLFYKNGIFDFILTKRRYTQISLIRLGTKAVFETTDSSYVIPT